MEDMDTKPDSENARDGRSSPATGYATAEITDTERLDWLIDWLDEYLNRDMPPACYMMSPDRDDIDRKIREARESHNKKLTDGGAK